MLACGVRLDEQQQPLKCAKEHHKQPRTAAFLACEPQTEGMDSQYNNRRVLNFRSHFAAASYRFIWIDNKHSGLIETDNFFEIEIS